MISENKEVVSMISKLYNLWSLQKWNKEIIYHLIYGDVTEKGELIYL